VLWWSKGTNGRRTLSGARQTHEEIKRTTYVIKNNATSSTGASSVVGDMATVTAMAVGSSSGTPLFIDHVADPRHEGYTIMTTDHAIKQTTAFTRYRHVLEPQAEVRFVVEERATHTSTHGSLPQLKKLLASQLNESVLAKADCQRLEAIVDKFERRRLLAKIESELARPELVGSSVSEQELHGWREQRALPTQLLTSLDGLHALKAKRAEGQRQLSLSRARIEEVFTNQDRLRENIRSFEKFGTNVLTERYLKDLDKEEDELIAKRRANAALEEADAAMLTEMKATLLVLAADVARVRESLELEVQE